MTLARKLDRKYTVKDYMTWPDEERWELINGTAYDMSPAPGTKHQRIVGSVHRILGNKLSGKSCVPFIAPTDVVLSDKDVVQPDVVVVCDKAKITDANIQGAPELVVEVLSPSTALKDRREKKALYEKQGVREYVIIDPIASYAERFVLKDGFYSLPDILGPDEVLVLQSLEDMEVPLSEVFEIEELKNDRS
jgi:Uma2 family endonuclease